ncbi:hypothetical protein DBV05_g12233 [Lasiodiplodia theobromae]|uniref:Uncharacterized protein n=1 Tax=Lasiodiplodia theobromae TaxID=45133 RepID=A0A5N5CUQ7_9PEZI|nr:hypothetical protein DBV05_g12233 [Lasiodiplodia theobromae]
MVPSTITSLALGLLAAIPMAHAAESSLHYRLRARVTGPKNGTTPPVDGWPVEVHRLGVPTRLPPDYMWGVLINTTFWDSRGGDVFYTQPFEDGKAHIRTDAPNAANEVTPFGITALAGSDKYPMDGVEMAATRYITTPPEEVTDITVDDKDVPFLYKPGVEKATFAACTGLYQEWATLYWIDVGKYGTDPIHNTGPEYQDCVQVELVPECTSDGPSYDGLEERPCVADITTVL